MAWRFLNDPERIVIDARAASHVRIRIRGEEKPARVVWMVARMGARVGVWGVNLDDAVSFDATARTIQFHDPQVGVEEFDARDVQVFTLV